MEAFKTIIWIVNIFSSLAVITLVLMQHGKGADAGANFGGSGSAQGVFGSGGNANFLTRMTGVAAFVFFATCLALGYINTNSTKSGGLDFSNVQQTTQHNMPNHNTASAVAMPQMQESASAPAAAMSASDSSINPAAAATAAATAATAKAVADNQKDNSKKTVDNKKSAQSSSKSADKKTEKTTDKKTSNSKKTDDKK